MKTWFLTRAAGVIIGSIIFTSVVGQDGWDLIRSNKHREARNVFQAQLEKDSLNENALKGMIFLSDLEDDQLSRDKAIERLVKKNWDPYLYDLFPVYESKKELLGKKDFPAEIRIPLLLEKADDLEYNRDFASYDKIINSLFTPVKWAFIGPFPNINGYGFVVENELEKEKFQLNKSYTPKNQTELNWVKPSVYSRFGWIDFNNHLNTKPTGVYYANGYVLVNEKKPFELRLSRKYPVKIWIDGQLIFEDPEILEFQWDYERLKMELEPGRHRILIKYAVGDYFTGKDGGSNGGGLFGYNEDYDEDFGDGLSSLFDFDFGFRPKPGKNALAIRFTDESGEIVPFVQPSEEGDHLSAAVKVTVESGQTMRHFKEKLDQNPNDLFNYYAYFKAVQKAGLLEKTEEFFLDIYNKNSDIIFFKYLLSEVYKENGKKEKADHVLGQVNHENTPIFALLKKELKEIDPENEGKKYMAKLQYMHNITPSNYGVISKMLKYYDSKGMKKERKEFAQAMIDKFPVYKDDLEEYLEDNYKPYDSQIGNKSDYITKKEQKKAAKNVKKHFSVYDYKTLIRKYKGEENNKEVIRQYDAILARRPTDDETMQEKAEFLFNINKQQEALIELDKILAFSPYHSGALELKGDIYSDLGDDKKALELYKEAKRHESGGGYSLFGYGGGQNLDEKIEKITGPKAIKDLFTTPDFEEMMADEKWKELYKDDESVVVGYTYDLHYEEDGTTRLFTKMLIHIQTEAGAASWTQFDFGFLGDLNLVRVVKKNGAELIPDKSGSFVVFKNLEAGDYIKLEASSRWRSSSELGTHLNQFCLLSMQAPVYKAKIEISVPEASPFRYQLNNLKDKPVKRTDKNMDFYKWEITGIKKVIEEEAILDIYDLYAIIQFGTLEDWTPVVDWYKAKTYRKLEPNYELLAIRDSIIKPEMTDQDKVIAIYNYITKDINYSFTPLLQSNYIPKNSDLTICSRIGDCKDAATLMISLLRSVGIESYYVLVKTNQYFHMKTLPGLMFDHVIAGYVLNGKMNYVDLTTNHYPYYVINENDIGAYGLLIKDTEKELLVLPQDDLDTTKNMVVHEIKAVLNKDKSIDMEVSSVFPGLEGGSLREIHYLKSKDNFQNELMNRMGKGIFENLSMKEYSFENLDQFTPPLKGSFKLNSYNFSDNILDIHFFRIPFMVGVTPSTIISGNQRFNTIDLTDITNTAPCLQKITLTFANGTIPRIPKDLSLDSPYGTYRLTFKKLHIKTIYIEKYMKFNKVFIPVDEFDAFKEFYMKLLDMDRTKIAINVN